MSTENKGQEKSKKEIYEFETGYPVFSIDWDWRKPGTRRLAFTSFLENMNNKVNIISLEEESGTLQNVCSFNHSYPPTKVMWMPYPRNDKSDLLATSGDVLRIWEVKDKKVQLKSNLQGQTPGSEYVAPLASFDWNAADVNMIGTASIDTTCTIWDLEHERAVAQLIAHDKEVFDMAFTAGVNVFATVGADGSVRLFDLRNLEHSTIIFESSKYTPLLRVDWSPVEPNYLATVMVDNPMVVILDIRHPSLPLIQLTGHSATANSVDWSPNSSNYIATGSDDSNAFIWDLRTSPKQISNPYLAYNSPQQINAVRWSSADPSYIAISMENMVQVLRI